MIIKVWFLLEVSSRDIWACQSLHERPLTLTPGDPARHISAQLNILVDLLSGFVASVAAISTS